MFTRILVPLDGSPLAEQTLPYVRILGAAANTPISLIRIFDPVPPDLAEPAHGLYETQIAASLRDVAVDYLNSIKSGLGETGSDISCEAFEGRPTTSSEKLRRRRTPLS
ncbi:MAG: hypothetical protein FI731_08100 [SAR202 cluster bacterium]|nr:hypothetical protein [SAR202 cluster bacterium]